MSSPSLRRPSAASCRRCVLHVLPDIGTAVWEWSCSVEAVICVGLMMSWHSRDVPFAPHPHLLSGVSQGAVGGGDVVQI